MDKNVKKKERKFVTSVSHERKLVTVVVDRLTQLESSLGDSLLFFFLFFCFFHYLHALFSPLLSYCC